MRLNMEFQIQHPTVMGLDMDNFSNPIWLTSRAPTHPGLTVPQVSGKPLPWDCVPVPVSVGWNGFNSGKRMIFPNWKGIEAPRFGELKRAIPRFVASNRWPPHSCWFYLHPAHRDPFFLPDQNILQHTVVKVASNGSRGKSRSWRKWGTYPLSTHGNGNSPKWWVFMGETTPLMIINGSFKFWKIMAWNEGSSTATRDFWRVMMGVYGHTNGDTHARWCPAADGAEVSKKTTDDIRHKRPANEMPWAKMHEWSLLMDWMNDWMSEYASASLNESMRSCNETMSVSMKGWTHPFINE